VARVTAPFACAAMACSAVDVRGDASQFIGGAASGLDVLGGQHDLDAGGEQHQPPRPVLRLLDRPANSGSGDTDLALGQPEQGQARLRLAAARHRVPIRLLGATELAAQPMQLRSQVMCIADRRMRGALQPLAGVPHRFGRVVPCGVQEHDLRPMHKALATIRHQIGLRFTPVGQRSRPLLGPLQVEDQLARFDHRAVRDAHDHG
jgi:hypothetical protein